MRKSRARFRRFILDHCAGFFRGGNFRARHCKITKAELPRVLNAVYDARSDYLHKGEPMYLSTVMRGQNPKWDTDSSLGMQVDQRRYTKEQKLPYPFFFHSLVRHCLLQYLDRAVER